MAGGSQEAEKCFIYQWELTEALSAILLRPWLRM